jgi:hypothetical protein
MAVYIEEQIQALAKMCEAFIVQLHFTGDKGEKHEGHNSYPASGCKHETCKSYAEAHRQLVFGERSFYMAELRGENERLFQRIAELEEQLGIGEAV